MDIVYMKHFLEHFPNLILTISEVRRILKLGGEFRVVVPHAGGIHAHTPGHEQLFTYRKLPCADSKASLVEVDAIRLGR